MKITKTKYFNHYAVNCIYDYEHPIFKTTCRAINYNKFGISLYFQYPQK